MTFSLFVHINPPLVNVSKYMKPKRALISFFLFEPPITHVGLIARLNALFDVFKKSKI